MKRHAKASSAGSTRGQASCLLLASLLALALFASSASASVKYAQTGSIDGSTTTAGSFGQLLSESVAVNGKNGHILIADSSAGLVYDYASPADPSPATWDGSTTPAGSFGAGRVAVAADDSTGDVYVLDTTHAVLDKFDETGALIASFGDSSPSHDGQLAATATPAGSFSGPLGLGVDQATHKLYVIDSGHNVVDAFDEGGAYLSQFDGSPSVSFSSSYADGFAANDKNSRLYVSDSQTVKAYEFDLFGAYLSTWDGSGTPAGSFGGGYTSVAAHNASGMVYVADTSNGVVDAFDEAGAYEGQIKGLTEPRGIAVEQSSGSVYVSDGTTVRIFAIVPPVLPRIDRTYITGVTAHAAELGGWIDPNGFDTTYHFEYGTSDCSANPCTAAPVPDTDIGSEDLGDPLDQEQKALGNHLDPRAAQHIEGLSPDTTYHYRLVASNAAGTVPGPDLTLHTQPLATPFQLPDGRAYEMVSPVVKNGVDIGASEKQTRSSTDGNAVTFMSLNALGDSHSGKLTITYVAQRTAADGWSTHALTPSQPPTPILFPSNENQSYYSNFTNDLSKAILYSKVALTNAPNVATAINLYRRDNILDSSGADANSSSSYQLLTDSVEQITEDQQGYFGGATARVADTTPDFDHVAFESWNNLTQDTVEDGLDPTAPKLYEWDNGVQRLAGILPNGDPAEKSVAGIGRPADGFRFFSHNMISDDGSKIFMTLNPDDCEGNIIWWCGSIFMRLDHSVTVPLTASEKTNGAGPEGHDPGGPRPAKLWDATPDGSKVYFTTFEQLTDDDSNGTNDLYVYDTTLPPSDPHNLTLLSGSGGGPVIGVSDDGSYVYFWSHQQLVPGQTVTESERKVYVWHNGTLRSIGGADLVGIGHEDAPWGNDGAIGRNMSRVTASGGELVFTTKGTYRDELTGYDSRVNARDPNASKARTEIYVYSYDSDTLRCASCNPTNGQPEHGGANLSEQDYITDLTANFFEGAVQYLTHALSDDGSKVFFSSPEQLVPQDSNGKWDAYEYDVNSEEPHLLSTGQCNCDSFFAEASPDGEDAFFTTVQQLVRIDQDNLYDLYDARVGGGIASQNALPPAQCEGDACQPAAVAPNDPTPSSATYKGPGNPNASFKKHRRKRHQQKRHHRRAAKHNRGGAK